MLQYDTSTENILPVSDPTAFNRRLRSRRHTIKTFEAKVNNNRTVFEKIADALTSRLGSMPFLFLNLIWFSLWILINTGLLPVMEPFDPFPFGLLTMIVSLEAIFLAIIVLISQNRAAKIDDIRDEIDLHITTVSEEEITKMMELQVMILEKNGIDVSKDKELQEMLQSTDQERIEKKIEKELE